MKKRITTTGDMPKKQRTSSPAPMILRASAIIICIMYICGIVLLMLPETVCDRRQAITCAQEILAVSCRAAVLGMMFSLAAAFIDIRYPDSD